MYNVLTKSLTSVICKGRGKTLNYLLAAVFAFAMSAGLTAEARSITSVERVAAAGAKSLNVTFEAGESGDTHALYIAYDTEDKGDNIANWAALQRGCVVADDATSATIPVSPLLTGAGYTVCRVFLTTSAAPYDTLIESLRQTGTQYIDTGIYPNYTSVAVMDVKLDSNSTAQQRFFAVSGDDASAVFAFDVYINGNTKTSNGPIRGISSACKDGKGDFKAACAFTSNRLLISLSAAENHHIAITNLETGAELVNVCRNTQCTATSAATLFIFAQHHVNGTTLSTKQIAQGANLYSFTMTTNSMVACDYKPCKLGNRVGVYDSVTDTIIYSASGTDFDAANSGSPVACSLLAGETQIAAAPAANGLFSDYTWRGTAVNWGDTDAWTKDGDPATWVAGNNAIFETANATVTLAANAVANSIAFNADTTISTNGTDAATLAVKSVAVDTGVSATIAAPTSVAFEKTGLGTLTLTENRTDATTVTEGTLKMVSGATVAGLTLGTDGGEPVTFDYGGQTLQQNPQDYLVTGSTVTLTNGIFTTAANYDLNLRDDIAGQVFPSVLTIAKDATLGKTTTSKKVYICKDGSGSSTVNVAGGSFEITGGSEASYIQHKSVSGRVNINVTDGGLLSFPGVVYALCRGDINVTSPSLYMTFSGSTFNAGGNFYFENSFSSDNYFNVPTTPTGVFAATNSVVSVGGNSFLVGRNTQDEKSSGSLRADFEGSTVTAKTFAVYYDRPLNNARFNNTRFVFGAASGSIAASDGEANWFTVGADGLTLDTQEYSATLNANLGGSGAVTKVGAGTLTVARDQATTGGFTVSEGTLAVNGGVTFAGPVEFAADTSLDIVGYNGTTVLGASTLTLPTEGTVALTLDGGAFPVGVYTICAASGLSKEDGAKFEPSTGEEAAAWSVSGNTLILTVGTPVHGRWRASVSSGARMSVIGNWEDGVVPAAGEDIDFSNISSATTIIADTERTFRAVTMGAGVITFSGEIAAKSFTDTSKITVGVNSTVTIVGNLEMSDQPTTFIVNKVNAGGKFIVTERIVSATDRHVDVVAEAGSGFIIADGLEINGDRRFYSTLNKATQNWAIGSQGITGTGHIWCRSDKANDSYYYAYTNDFTVSAWTVIRANIDHHELNTTGYGDGLPHTITLNAGFASSGALFIAGTGKVVVNCEPLVGKIEGDNENGAYSGAVTVKDTATLAINAGKKLTSGKITVNNGATLEVAESAASAGAVAVTLGGNLTLQDNASLGFNFTNRNTPQLALASGKTLSFSGAGATNITVKVSGDVWPRGGEHQLTTCGGFDAEGVSVTLAEGAPEWAEGVRVAGGNLVLAVKPRGLMLIIR